MSDFTPGDLVTYLDERWTVDSYHPGAPCQPSRVTLGRSSGSEGTAHGEVVEADARQVQLVTRFAERSMTSEHAGGCLVLRDKGGEIIAVITDSPGANQ